MKIFWFGIPAVVVRFDQFRVIPEGDGDPVEYFIREAAAIHGVTSEGVLVDGEANPVPNASRDPWTPEEEAEMEELKNRWLQSMSCDPEEWR